MGAREPMDASAMGRQFLTLTAKTLLAVMLFLTLILVTAPNCHIRHPSNAHQQWQHLACHADSITLPFLDVVHLFGNMHLPNLAELLLLLVAAAAIAVAGGRKENAEPPNIRIRHRRLRWIWARRLPFSDPATSLFYFVAQRDA